MIINPTFSFAPGTTSAEMTEFENAVNTVIAKYDHFFTNNVTLNIDYAYGEEFNGISGNKIVFQPMPNASGGGAGLGINNEEYNSFSYSTVVSKLTQEEQSTNQINAYSTLPSASPFGNDTLWVSSAQQKALGLTGGGSNLAGFDGVVGIISNEELAAGGFTADWTSAAPANNSQFYMLGTIEHETSEVMGRISMDGTDAINNAPSYTIMDLFRYSAPNQRDTTDGNPSYFSIDNGNTVLDYWNNPALASGDLGDWAPSGPGGIDPTGPDAYLNVSHGGVINEVTATDVELMNVLGWDVAPPVITVQAIQNDYLAITRTALSSSQATTVANSIDAGTTTEAQYVAGLLSQVADTTIPAVAVEGSMYGAVGTSAEVTSLTTNFLPPQITNATNNGLNAQVYACEALGLVFAFGNENGATTFANKFGPTNSSMPNSTAGDAAYAAAAAAAIFASASTTNLVNVLEGFVSNWKAFFTANGVSGISSPTANQIDLAARGAAWGDMVGVALANNLGPLSGQVTNFL